jgi:hypothetical protein
VTSGRNSGVPAYSSRHTTTARREISFITDLSFQQIRSSETHMQVKTVNTPGTRHQRSVGAGYPQPVGPPGKRNSPAAFLLSGLRLRKCLRVRQQGHGVSDDAESPEMPQFAPPLLRCSPSLAPRTGLPSPGEPLPMRSSASPCDEAWPSLADWDQGEPRYGRSRRPPCVR